MNYVHRKSIKNIDVLLQIFNSKRALTPEIPIGYALKYINSFDVFEIDYENPVVLLLYKTTSGYLAICNKHKKIGIITVVLIDNDGKTSRFPFTLGKGECSFINILPIIVKTKLVEIPKFSGIELNTIKRELYSNNLEEEIFFMSQEI